MIDSLFTMDDVFLAFQAAGVALVAEEVAAAAAAAIVAGLGAVDGAGRSLGLERGDPVSEAFVLRSKLKRGSRRSFRAAS